MTSRTARFLAPRSAAEHRLRRAVVALARTHEFARRLANTGRMAQANAYPPSPWAPAARARCRTSRFDGTTVMRLLGDGTRFSACGSAPSRDAGRGARRRARARWPLACTAVDAAGALARHLGAAPGSFVLVRPDAYVAAQLVDATPRGGGDARRSGCAARPSRRADPSPMKTDANIADPDGFYEAWVAAHEGLSDAESADLDARLVLLLANQVGEMQVLLDCIAAAREQGRRDGSTLAGAPA